MKPELFRLVNYSVPTYPLCGPCLFITSVRDDGWMQETSVVNAPTGWSISTPQNTRGSDVFVSIPASQWVIVPSRKAGA